LTQGQRSYLIAIGRGKGGLGWAFNFLSLLDERAAGVAVDIEGLGLATGAVEREHELSAEAFPQRVCGDELLQFSDQVRVLAEGEIASMRRSSAARRSSSSRAIAVCANGVGELGERRAAPEGEGLAQRLGR
jgi:hypothetical protein